MKYHPGLQNTNAIMALFLFHALFRSVLDPKYPELNVFFNVFCSIFSIGWQAKLFGDKAPPLVLGNDKGFNSCASLIACQKQSPNSRQANHKCMSDQPFILGAIKELLKLNVRETRPGNLKVLCKYIISLGVLLSNNCADAVQLLLLFFSC